VKQCRCCGLLKDDSAFFVKHKNGKRVLRATCKECYEKRMLTQPLDDPTLGRNCTVCDEWKLLSAFHKHRIGLYGREPVCKACKAEKRRLRDAEYPDRARDIDLRAKYGITLEEYEEMTVGQEGRCAICGVSVKKLVVDHNHKTGKVWALLCHHCNTMIGSARENISTLVNAAAYLYAEQHALAGAVRAEIAFITYDDFSGERRATVQ
jgi:Recombination endonuclease VII